MGKLGDLIVKLKLDGKEYKQGLQKAQNDTRGFGNVLKNIKATAVAAWGAIGAAAFKAADAFAHASNKFGDVWDRNMSKMKGAWTEFIRSVTAMDFNNLFGRMRDAAQSAGDLTAVRDAGFEVKAGTSVMRAENAGALADLEVAMRDQNKTLKERTAAAEEYLAILKPIYEIESRYAQRLAQATFADWATGLNLGTFNQLKYAKEFIKLIGDTEFTMAMTQGGSRYEQYVRGQFGGDFASFAKGDAFRAMYGRWQEYNDGRNEPFTQAITGWLTSEGAYAEETKKVQRTLNTLTKAAEKTKEIKRDLVQEFSDSQLSDILSQEFELPILDFEDAVLDLDSTIDNSAITEYLDTWDEQVARFQNLMAEFRDACIDGVVNGTQYLTDALFGLEEFNAGRLAQNLLEPLADLAVRQGEILIAQGIGVEACKEALDSLNGWAAIAAGTALIAIGATAKSGLASLASRGGGTTSTSTSASSSSVENTLNSELTVYVKGKISGNDIVISGQRTLNAWSR